MKDNSWSKFTAISRQDFSDSLLGVSAGIFQRALVDESGMIRTKMATNIRSENGRSVSHALGSSGLSSILFISFNPCPWLEWFIFDTFNIFASWHIAK
jgi:hypothetical protein